MCERSAQSVPSGDEWATTPRGWAPINAITVDDSPRTVNLSFIHYDDNRNPYVYAHTQRDVLELVAEIERLSKRPVTKGAFTIAVTSPDHFPLSWYLRYYQAGFYGRVVRTDDLIIIGAEQQETELAATLGERYQRINSYTLRPGVTLVLYVRRDLSL